MKLLLKQRTLKSCSDVACTTKVMEALEIGEQAIAHVRVASRGSPVRRLAVTNCMTGPRGDDLAKQRPEPTAAWIVCVEEAVLDYRAFICSEVVNKRSDEDVVGRCSKHRERSPSR